ncbi:MAG: choice-of-anchor D domain-containing protein [Bacteroidetes bacterium]|nr:choice-of-anchor D domain-containing protein [Bacteroidota bacterium]
MTRILLRSAVLSLLALLLATVTAQSSKADCAYSLSTADSAWSFSANAGSEQTRTFWVTNTGSTTITLEISLSGTDAFSVTPHIDTLAAGDSVQITVVFHPGSGASAGSSVHGTITISKVGSDCRKTLGLVGKVTGSNGGGNGGHDAVVIFDPGKWSFGALAQGADSCHTFTLINWTGKTIVLTGWSMLHDRGFSVDPSFTDNVTLDSGETKQFTVCYTSDSSRHEVVDSLDVTWHYDGQNDTHHTDLAVTAAYKKTDSGNGGGGTSDGLVADPGEYSFGALAAGASACKDIVITNHSSSQSIVITGWTSCDGQQFSLRPSFSGNDTLAPGSSITITMCYTASSTAGSAKCNLTVNYTIGSATKQLVVGFGATSQGSNNSGDACLRTEQTAGYKDPIVIGASANRALQLINKTGADITITNDSVACEDARAFTLTSSLPITVPAHGTANLNYTFTPFALNNGDPKGVYSGCVIFWLSGDSITCHEAKGTLVGFAVHDADTHTNDTVIRELYPNEPRVISIESHGDRPTKTFTFTNNLTVDVTVNGVTLKNGTYFQIQSTTPATTPFVLHPSDNMTVTVIYTANDKDVHYDTLVINSTHNLLGTGFQLQGVRAATSSVRAEIPSGVTISLTPNPMSSRLVATVTGTTSATIEVYDMLGKQLTSSATTGTWVWNATTDAGARVASGSYIVRISGVSTDGIPFVTSKRVVVTNE